MSAVNPVNAVNKVNAVKKRHGDRHAFGAGENASIPTAALPSAWHLVHGDKLVDMFENLELGLVPRKSYDIDESFFASFKESK
ncbi:MAG: hypothetical protein ACKO8U_11490 [Pirellula sp.]